jgi:hypothetical protein
MHVFVEQSGPTPVHQIGSAGFQKRMDPGHNGYVGPL